MIDAICCPPTGACSSLYSEFSCLAIYTLKVNAKAKWTGRHVANTAAGPSPIAGDSPHVTVRRQRPHSPSASSGVQANTFRRRRPTGRLLLFTALAFSVGG
jgi:hypothetical protein